MDTPNPHRTPIESAKRYLTCCYRFELSTVFLGFYSLLLAIVYFSSTIHNAPGETNNFEPMFVNLNPSITYEILAPTECTAVQILNISSEIKVYKQLYDTVPLDVPASVEYNPNFAISSSSPKSESGIYYSALYSQFLGFTNCTVNFIVSSPSFQFGIFKGVKSLVNFESYGQLVTPGAVNGSFTFTLYENGDYFLVWGTKDQPANGNINYDCITTSYDTSFLMNPIPCKKKCTLNIEDGSKLFVSGSSASFEWKCKSQNYWGSAITLLVMYFILFIALLGVLCFKWRRDKGGYQPVP